MIYMDPSLEDLNGPSPLFSFFRLLVSIYGKICSIDLPSTLLLRWVLSVLHHFTKVYLFASPMTPLL